MTDSSWQQVLDFASSTEWSLGLARSGGDTIHWGIRVHSDRFAETFAKAFPSKPIPKVLVTHYLAKVTPIPLGASAENIRTWLETQAIPGKPIRPLNSTTWLVSTVNKVQRQFLTWGSTSVLLQPVQSWQDKTRPTVLAGQKAQLRPWTDAVDWRGGPPPTT